MFDLTLGGQGTSVSRNSLTGSFFASIGFSEEWDTTVYPPVPVFLSKILFPFNTSLVGHGEDITKITAMNKLTYSSLDFALGSVWAIRDGVEYPRILNRGIPKPGVPGESVKRVIFVDKHDDGTMFYDGEIYRSMKMSQLISKFVGDTGEVVTQVWEGEKQVAPDGNTYVFLASGVQDPDFPGGYGGYTDEQSRTVTLREDRSIDVNFYYTAMELPPYNYLMRVAVPDGIAHIAIMKSDVSSIKVQMHDGSICTVDIVLPDDEQASPIRVMLPTGIYALKKIEIPAK